ncbi:MAG: cbb3-type cytochrome c oxidase N-terminal domain-containing protein [Rubripirellula sp.]
MSDSVKDSSELPEGAPDDPLTGHDYDGIQEYDNPLPGWWKWLFIASILFTPPYFWFYHNGAEGRTLSDRYDRELAANLKLQFAEIGELTADRETVVKYLYEDSWLRIGKAVFKSNCVSCHGREGVGLVGPNLRDDHYKNVKDIADILKVLENGANAGAMPAWKNRLSTNEIVLVSSYVASLRGSEDGNGKPPEGNEISPWPAAPVEDEELDIDSEPSGSEDAIQATADANLNDDTKADSGSESDTTSNDQ